MALFLLRSQQKKKQCQCNWRWYATPLNQCHQDRILFLVFYGWQTPTVYSYVLCDVRWLLVLDCCPNSKPVTADRSLTVSCCTAYTSASSVQENIASHVHVAYFSEDMHNRSTNERRIHVAAMMRSQTASIFQASYISLTVMPGSPSF